MEQELEQVQEPSPSDSIDPAPRPPGAPAVTAPWLRTHRARLVQIYVIVALIAFAVLFFLARSLPYLVFDLPVAHAVQTLPIPGISALMLFISGLGFAPLVDLLVGLIVVYLYIIGLRWEAVCAAFAAIGVGLLGFLIKLVVHRDRPTPDLMQVLSPLNDYSFPSGHVLLYTAFIGFVAFLIFILAPRGARRTLGLIALGVLIALVGTSRVYMGQHFASDVLGAYLLGSVWLTLTIYVYRWGKPRFFVTQPLAPPSATEQAHARP